MALAAAAGSTMGKSGKSGRFKLMDGSLSVGLQPRFGFADHAAGQLPLRAQARAAGCRSGGGMPATSISTSYLQAAADPAFEGI
ncbi:hypothetical protein B0T37_19740 [Chromobacterium violaceum]|nr:hypothetical protein B0T38_20140 [Chromobacterium violaceum]OQS21323.1 hypothetical protein B0T37_19740 [Chromobacterium violaceum]